MSKKDCGEVTTIVPKEICVCAAVFNGQGALLFNESDGVRHLPHQYTIMCKENGNNNIQDALRQVQESIGFMGSNVVDTYGSFIKTFRVYSDLFSITDPDSKEPPIRSKHKIVYAYIVTHDWEPKEDSVFTKDILGQPIRPAHLHLIQELFETIKRKEIKLALPQIPPPICYDLGKKELVIANAKTNN